MREPFATTIDSELRVQFDKVRAERGRMKVQEALDAAVQEWVSAEEGQPMPAGAGVTEGNKTLPPKDVIEGFPRQVIETLKRHWNDERYRACIAAVGAVWDGADGEIMESLSKNCTVFQRFSRSGGRKHGRRSRRAEEVGVDEVLEKADLHKPRNPRGKEKT